MEILQFIVGAFSRRFFLNALLPTFVFLSTTLIAIIAQTSGIPLAINLWTSQAVIVQILIAFLYIALTYFASGAVASQWRGIVRVFEGYPLTVVAKRFDLNPPGRRWHEVHRHYLRNSSSANLVRSYYLYPPDEFSVMPTRLGNILSAGERYPLERYGIDGIIFWPRLYHLLPEHVKKEYDEFIINYEFPIVVAFESVIATLAISIVTLVAGGSPWVLVATILGGISLAYASYVLSLSSAEELAEQQRSAFDLYRDRLIFAWPAVRDIHDEKEAFLSITDFVVDGRYVGPSWDEARDRRIARLDATHHDPA